MRRSLPGSNSISKTEKKLGLVRKGRYSLSELISAMPEEARGSLVFGVSEEYSPIFLRLNRTPRRRMLVLGDQGTGKSEVLKVIAKSAMIGPTPNLGWLAITENPNEWEVLTPEHPNAPKPPIYTFGQCRENDLIYNLAKGVYHDRINFQTLLLLIDDFSLSESLEKDTREQLMWILENGPLFRVCPILTLNNDKARDFASLLGGGWSLIHGKNRDNPYLRDLRSQEFTAIDENNIWIKFNLPSLD